MATISKWHRTATIGLKFGGRLLNSSICRDKDEWPILRYFLLGLPLLLIPRQDWPDFELWAKLCHSTRRPQFESRLIEHFKCRSPFKWWPIRGLRVDSQAKNMRNWFDLSRSNTSKWWKNLQSSARLFYFAYFLYFLSFWNSRLLVFDRTRNKKCFWYCAINIEGKILSCCKW